MEDSKVSEDVAEQQIAALLGYYDINFNDIEIEDGAEAAKTMKNTLTRAIRRGALEITVEGDLTVTQKLSIPIGETESITYTDKVAKARLAMDHESSKKQQARMYAFMSTMCGIPTAQLIKLKGADLGVYNRLAVIFSMV